jgi:hypothetical protein
MPPHPEWLRGYLDGVRTAATFVAAQRDHKLAPVTIPLTAERAREVAAILVECGAIDPADDA